MVTVSWGLLYQVTLAGLLQTPSKVFRSRCKGISNHRDKPKTLKAATRDPTPTPHPIPTKIQTLACLVQRRLNNGWEQLGNSSFWSEET